MELGEIAEELYGLPRADFTAARDEQVRAARAAGEKDLAATIGKLRRPTVSGWLVNQLARDRPDAVAELTDLGAALREAHQNLDGGALRELSARRHSLVNELLGVVRSLGEEAGQPVGEPAARELEEMFTAALGSAEAARALAGGRVTAAKDVADPASVSWPGVEQGALPEPAQPRSGAGRKPAGSAPTKSRPATSESGPAKRGSRAAPRGSSPPAEPEPGPGPDPARERARMKARAELDRLNRACDQADEAAAEARSEHEAAEEAEDDAHRRVAELRSALTVAEREEQRSRESARAARRAAEDADRAVREARRRQEIAEQRLDALND